MKRLQTVHIAVALACSALLMAACASKPATKDSAPSAVDVVTRTGELPPQTLPPGACGLFLWTNGEPLRFVFFSKAGTDTAVMDVDGEERTLRLTSAKGDLFGQFMTRMTYASDKGNVGVSFRPGEQLDGGQRIDGGRLSLVDKDGWETMIPVFGLSACQPDSQ
ncbi:MAG: hypothetical protein V7675_11425 [Hyphomonas sp.]|uniref:hypothetical protein n=1 Tax=Hyphomonas sp. TaxID=87 RepID=UPI003001A8A9